MKKMMVNKRIWGGWGMCAVTKGKMAGKCIRGRQKVWSGFL